MIGVKLHLEGSGLDLTDDAHVAALSAVFDRIQKHRAPVLLHASDPYGLPLEGVGLANLAWILQEHPRTRVAHAHCAGNADDQSIELWLRVGGSGFSEETSYVDVSACLAFFRDAPLATRELMVWRLRKWGIARVLFGSDYFRYGEDETPAQALDTLSRYPFTQQELKTILDNDGSTWLGRHAGASAGRGR